MTRRARLLIVDDHDLARAGLRYMLGSQPGIEVVGEASSGEQAVALAADLQPDLVLMDVRMRGMDGFAATRAIKTSCPNTSVIIMTMYEDPEYLSQALLAGAAGYVRKEATRGELKTTVLQVLRGETPFHPGVLGDLLRRIPATGAESAGRAPLAEKLTPREREVLALVMQGQTNKEIAQTLHITPGTAKSHVERIIRKLDATDRTQAAVRAINLGLAPA